MYMNFVHQISILALSSQRFVLYGKQNYEFYTVCTSLTVVLPPGRFSTVCLRMPEISEFSGKGLHSPS